MNLKPKEKFLFWLISASLFAEFPATAAPPVSPSIFLGDFRLIRADYGMCDQQMSVNASGGTPEFSDLRFGTYYFPEINQPEQSGDDDVARIRSRSYTTDDFTLVHIESILFKSSSQTDRERTVVAMRGTTLTLESRGAFGSRNEPPTETYTRCVYRRVVTAAASKR